MPEKGPKCVNNGSGVDRKLNDLICCASWSFLFFLEAPLNFSPQINTLSHAESAWRPLICFWCSLLTWKWSKIISMETFFNTLNNCMSLVQLLSGLGYNLVNACKWLKSCCLKYQLLCRQHSNKFELTDLLHRGISSLKFAITCYFPRWAVYILMHTPRNKFHFRVEKLKKFALFENIIVSDLHVSSSMYVKHKLPTRHWKHNKE